MTKQVIIMGGVAMEVDLADLPKIQSRLSGTSMLYIDFTLTDPIEGTVNFLLGDQAFISTNVTGGAPVYPVITSWGSLRKFMSADGAERASDFEIEVAGKAAAVPSTHTKQFSMFAVLRTMNLRDVPVIVYQWNAADSSQEVIWYGYFDGMRDCRWGGGVPTVTLAVSERKKGLLVPVSDVVQRTDFPNAPDRSLGVMVRRAYGNWKTELNSSAGTKLPPPLFGLATKFVEGVVVDEAVASSSGPFSRTRFSKNDGTSVCEEAFSSSSGEPGGDIWCYLENSGLFACIDGADVSITNDSASLRTDVPNSPTVFVVLRLGEKGSVMSSGFNSVMHKPVDDDGNNFVTLNSTDTTLSYVLPALTIPGARVLDVRVAVDAGNIGNIDYGIWNPQDSGGANWWGGSKKESDGFVARRQVATTAANAYFAGDARVNVGQATDVEFTTGTFIARDGSNSLAPLEVKVARTSGSVDVYNVSAIVKVKMPQIKTGFRQPTFKRERIEDPSGDRWTPWQIVDPGGNIFSNNKSSSGIRFLSMAKYLKDDGSGTYTGTANKRINRAPEILHHILSKIGGLPCNTTAGTIGNFVDARIEDVSGEKEIEVAFGEEQESIGGAVNKIQAQWPGRIFQENGTWQFLGDDMNPHSSRMYRSTSDIVKISAKEDLVPGKSFRVAEVPFETMRNRVTLNYGHSFAQDKPSGTIRYDNPLAQELFGVSDEAIIDSPLPTKRDISGGESPAATYLAHYHGRVKARPRLTVTCALSQKFYDLRRGHVVEFAKDMESVGLECPAYRCGLFDYIFTSSTSSTNQANDVTPDFIPSSGTNSVYFGMSQQIDSLSAAISAAASYTTVNNGWKYYDLSAWTSLINVTTSDGVDPDDFFKTTSALRTLYFDRPTPTSWKKAELSFNSVVKGPCYWLRMDYTSATAAGSGNALATYPAKWFGRLFEVIEMTRKPGSLGDYPYVEVVLQEVI